MPPKVVPKSSKRSKPPLPVHTETPDDIETPAAAEKLAPRTPARRPYFLGLAILAVALTAGFVAGKTWPWFAPTLHDLSPEQLAAQPDGAVALHPGPWGNLEALPVYIEPPEEYLPIDRIQSADRRWRFPGYTPDQVKQLFDTAALTSDQSAELLDTSKWQVAQDAIYVNPSTRLILSLSPDSRKHIYSALTSDPSNIYGMMRCSFPADRFNDFFAQSDLPPETVDLVRQLSYPHGDLIFFCDVPVVLDTLKQPDQKVRLLKTLLRKSTLLLRLHITPDTNVDMLEHYWVKGAWGANVRPLLESLHHLPQGARIDIIELLPPLPTANLYSYPFPSVKPEDTHKDCHWTALNFFRDIPDNRYTDPATDRQALMNDYYPVLSDFRYGDILVLSRANGDIIHSCVYIADNIVYTKNSGNFRDPYILMRIPDMVSTFEAQIPENENLTINAYRSKYY